jgi:ribosomal protein L32
MRHTSSHTKNRRSHHALKGESIVKDKESGALRLPHRLDETTGMYRGKQIIPTEELKRRQARQERLDKRERAAGIENVPAHAHQPEAAVEQEEKKGVLGRFSKGGKAKARSGFGGGA